MEFQARRLKDAENASHEMRTEIKKRHSSQKKKLKSGTGDTKDNNIFLPQINQEYDHQEFDQGHDPNIHNISDMKKNIQDEITEEDAEIMNFIRWARVLVEQRRDSVYNLIKKIKEQVYKTMENQAEYANETLDQLTKENEEFQEKMWENMKLMERGLNVIKSAHINSMEIINNQVRRC